MKKILPVVFALLILVQIFMPIILKPAAAIDIILHGSLGITLIVLSAILGGVWWLRRKSQSIAEPELRNQMTASLLFQGMSALLLGGFAVFSIYEIGVGRSLAAIQRHGQRTMATVVDIYTDDCDKHGCSIDAKYRFTPKQGEAAGQQVIGYAELAHDNRHDPRLRHAQETHSIPIAYDVDDPANSTENFDDRAFAGDPMARSLTLIAGMGAMAVFMFVMLWGIIRSTRKKSDLAPVHG